MGQFSRFLQGVIVAKDKSGAYVPKKYIVRRHGSGYLNGSTEWLNDALDGDYERLVTEKGLDDLYGGKSVHKDFTAKSISDAFIWTRSRSLFLRKTVVLGFYRAESIGLWSVILMVVTVCLLLIKTTAEILSRSRLLKRHGGRGF